MPLLKSGSVVLISFPFTDAVHAKRRPALVLFDSGDGDILLARITTQRVHSRFDCEIGEWRSAGLKAPSFIRLHKLATLEKRLIEKELGLLAPSDWQQVMTTQGVVTAAIQQNRNSP